MSSQQQIESSHQIELTVGSTQYSIHYHDCGSGENVVVMLHGSGPGTTAWANFNGNITPLTDAGYRVILMDCPGWGKSSPLVCQTSRSDLNATILMALLDELAIGKVDLVGNSMGGHVAVAFTLAYPEIVNKLVLMGGGTGGKSLFQPTPAEGIKRLQKVYREPTLENLRAMMDIFVFDPSALTEDMLEARLAAIQAYPEHLQNFVRSQSLYPAQFPDVNHRLAEIACPTLIVWGREDQFVPLDIGFRLVAGIPHAELHVFNHCGHWVQWEKRTRFNNLLLNFLLPE
ncbi:alpha/beta fold hydrolase [Alteromonas lipolytica]|uniref:2-hydroxy-6-oxo-6-phenylhexa-2,4-dienoate hydrolase n=1 Tax=Alteromonas lipolytica TaxID=1856405 RepID=A0A1E8FJS9_9ALTE|nr:alpha/beta fold hydrolase [Alteromonas lipolytica]OFI36199.1 2-hydroxy-6-oxo-6-phenylhexa-2,4-dienoate hydrolase [Alteromonas lipolytica]GGF78640.1 2-hydroxy-6-oxononadienedioate/2-hydroxy-6-oxononatrienedioate hydrolase [Alteromonas lipolytica]